MTREQIRKALTPYQVFVCTLIGEVLNEPLDGVLAVASTIRNRVKADLYADTKPDWWGEGYDGVCLKSWQFSCWWEDNANSDRVYTIALAYIEKKEPTCIHPSRLEAFEVIARLVMDNVIVDTSEGADHYLTTALLRSSKAPSWTKLKRPVKLAGAHTFFRLETWEVR
jgi:N-acetylmuramoyl-L-alanine amidase